LIINQKSKVKNQSAVAKAMADKNYGIRHNAETILFYAKIISGQREIINYM
jgi:hypothetical protein